MNRKAQKTVSIIEKQIGWWWIVPYILKKKKMIG